VLYRKIIAVCSQNLTEHINTLCEQNVELLMLKWWYHWALEGYLIGGRSQCALLSQVLRRQEWRLGGMTAVIRSVIFCSTLCCLKHKDWSRHNFELPVVNGCGTWRDVTWRGAACKGRNRGWRFATTWCWLRQSDRKLEKLRDEMGGVNWRKETLVGRRRRWQDNIKIDFK
jgi:hypothetical protein